MAPSAPSKLWTPVSGAGRIEDTLRTGTLPASLAAQAPQLTLAGIIDLALRNNPATQSSWAQARAAADAYGGARGAYFPTVDASLTSLKSEQSGGKLQYSGVGTSTRSQLIPSLSLNYTVFDFGSRGGSVDQARQTAYALSFTHNEIVQSTVLRVEQAYYSYLDTRAVLDARQASVVEAEASYNAARQRDSLGLATRADVMLAKSSLAQAQFAAESAYAQVQSARSSLAIALGVSPTAPYDITGRAEDVPVGPVTLRVESFINQALRNRPDLQAARARANAARAAVRTARGSLLPSVSLSASTGYTWADPSQLTGRSYNLSLGLQVPLFDGLTKNYDLARAEADADAAAAQLAQVRDSVMAGVFTAYYNLQTATQQVGTSDDALASATEALGAMQARYRVGIASITDLLSAQSTLASARVQQAQTRWDWAQQLATLAHAAGALDARGNASIPLRSP